MFFTHLLHLNQDELRVLSLVLFLLWFFHFTFHFLNFVLLSFVLCYSIVCDSQQDINLTWCRIRASVMVNLWFFMQLTASRHISSMDHFNLLSLQDCDWHLCENRTGSGEFTCYMWQSLSWVRVWKSCEHHKRPAHPGPWIDSGNRFFSACVDTTFCS